MHRNINRLVALTCFCCSAAYAQDGQLWWLSGRIGDRELEVNYDNHLYFNEQVVGDRSERFGLLEQGLRLSAPIRQTEIDEWVIDGGVRVLDFDTGVQFPESREQFPGEIYDIRVGATYRRQLTNGWLAGGRLAVGSVSDRPFASGDEILVEGTGFLRIPSNDNAAWLLLLNYSNNRSFLQNVPLPGFAYERRFDQRLSVLAGLPFSAVRWSPVDKLTFDASYIIPRQVRAQASYQLLEPLRLYMGYAWDNERYLWSRRDDDEDRLFYYEQRVVAGVRWDLVGSGGARTPESVSDEVLWAATQPTTQPDGRRSDWLKAMWLDVSGGFAYDRYYFVGENYGDRAEDRIKISDGPIVRVQFGLRM